MPDDLPALTLAISPYVGLDFRPAPAQAEQALRLLSAELLCLEPKQGALRPIADGVYLDARLLDDAIARIQADLGGRSELGPSDFRDILDVTRKHLIPLLNYLDGIGVTVKDGQLRSVPRP